MIRDVEATPFPERYYWDRGHKRRPYQGATVPLTLELGPRAYRCLQIEARVGDVEEQLELWASYKLERERSLEKRLVELERLEAEIDAEIAEMELTNA